MSWTWNLPAEAAQLQSGGAGGNSVYASAGSSNGQAASYAPKKMVGAKAAAAAIALTAAIAVWQAKDVDLFFDWRAGSDGSALTDTIAEGGVWPSAPPATPFVYPSSPATILAIETDAGFKVNGTVRVGGVHRSLSDVVQGMVFAHSSTASEEVRAELPNATTPICSVGFLYRTTLNAPLYTQYGQCGIQGISDGDWAILSTYIDASGNAHACLETNGALWPATPSNAPTLDPAKTYWITIQYNRTAAKAYLRVYDALTFAQVGITVEANLVASPPYVWCVDFGQVASEGNSDSGAFSWYGSAIVDWTTGRFPLLPEIGPVPAEWKYAQAGSVAGQSAAANPTEVEGGSGGEYEDDIAANGDDGFEYGGSWYPNELAAGDAGGGSDEVIGGIRFLNVVIPAGATITSAHIDLYIVNGSGSGDLHLRIRAVDAANPGQFSSSSRPSGATLTTAYRDWTIAMSPLNRSVTSDDLAAIIQELVDSYSGLNGAVNVVLRNNGDSGKYLYFEDYYAAGTHRAVLHITWTVAGADVEAEAGAANGQASGADPSRARGADASAIAEQSAGARPGRIRWAEASAGNNQSAGAEAASTRTAEAAAGNEQGAGARPKSDDKAKGGGANEQASGASPSKSRAASAGGGNEQGGGASGDVTTNAWASAGAGNGQAAGGWASVSRKAASAAIAAADASADPSKSRAASAGASNEQTGAGKPRKVILASAAGSAEQSAGARAGRARAGEAGSSNEQAGGAKSSKPSFVRAAASNEQGAAGGAPTRDRAGEAAGLNGQAGAGLAKAIDRAQAASAADQSGSARSKLSREAAAGGANAQSGAARPYSVQSVYAAAGASNGQAGEAEASRAREAQAAGSNEQSAGGRSSKPTYVAAAAAGRAVAGGWSARTRWADAKSEAAQSAGGRAGAIDRARAGATNEAAGWAQGKETSKAAAGATAVAGTSAPSRATFKAKAGAVAEALTSAAASLTRRANAFAEAVNHALSWARGYTTRWIGPAIDRDVAPRVREATVDYRAEATVAPRILEATVTFTEADAIENDATADVEIK